MRIAYFCMLLLCLELKAQSNNPPDWQVIETGIDGIAFSLPGIPFSIDSVLYRFYNLGGDTTINYKILILKDLPTPAGQVYETIIEALSTRDSIQMISADSITYQGRVIIDGAFQTPTPNGHTLTAFFRYCYFDNKLLCFFISGPVGLYGELSAKKVQFFNSVHL